MGSGNFILFLKELKAIYKKKGVEFPRGLQITLSALENKE